MFDSIASWFSFITTPVSWVIVQFHTLYGSIFGPDTGWAWGLSIVSLVVLIRICLIPLFVKQIKSMRNMQVLQPKMKAIQERYKNDKQRQSEEMMKLYKETGTNPLSSCLPILVQSPFLFALYHVLAGIANGTTIGEINQPLLDSARKAHIFGAPLAAKFTNDSSTVAALHASLTDVRVVTAVLIVLMCASQFYTQRQLMTKNVDTTVKTPFMQQQKMLMYGYPVIFLVIGINFPLGVLVYWLTTNVWTMGQQMYVINQNPTPGSKAQDALLQRLLKSASAHGEIRSRRKRKMVGAIVGKGPDRNDIERKFITGLSKAGYAAQADGSLVKSEVAVTAEGEPVIAKRQQPKRQSKSQRQSTGAQAATQQRQTGQTQGHATKDADVDGGEQEKVSTQKQDAAQSEKRARANASTTSGSGATKSGSGSAKSGAGSARQAKSGQRKGQQRPKHPSKK
jgi:YidC/Oxa1 family membrane protein insertase